MGRNLTIVVAFLALGLAAAGINLANADFTPPWSDRYVFVAEFEDAAGNNADAKHLVTIAGVEVGQIVDWEVSDRGSARLTLSIEPGHRIHDNARAVMRTVNPLNQMYIEIDPGGPPGAPLRAGGMLPASQTERAIQPDEVMRHLDDRSRRALGALLRESDVALARAPEQLPEGLRATDSTLRHLRPALKALRTRRDKLSELSSGLSRIAQAVGGNQDRLATLADSAQQALRVVRRNDDELRLTLGELPGLNKQLRRALTGTQEVTNELDPVLTDLESASDTLPSALERTGELAEELGRTVDKAKPVVAKAKPVATDLRPLVADADVALSDVRPVSRRLPHDTAVLESYLTDLQAFVYNTSSVFSPRDAQGTIIRGHAVVPVPDGGAIPGARGGYAPSPEESGAGRSGRSAEGASRNAGDAGQGG
ncbi:MlaD family protein [Haloechinothrix salitolerans]|uniref:MlaD family protein n=1 Tax=Haloechinothrix salitolerans TaxID=926830 RepID=A0ABW2BX33_9PSEU